MSPWTLYQITRCDVVLNVSIAVAVTALASGVLACIAAIGQAGVDQLEAFPPWLSPLVRKLAFVLAFSLAVACVTPTTNQMAAIVVIPAIVNSETVQEEASELYGLAKTWMKQQVDAETEEQP